MSCVSTLLPATTTENPSLIKEWRSCMVVSEPGMYSRPLLTHHFGLRFLSAQLLVRQNIIEKEGEGGQKTNIFSQIGDAKGETTYLRLIYITNFTQKTVTAWHKQL